MKKEYIDAITQEGGKRNFQNEGKGKYESDSHVAGLVSYYYTLEEFNTDIFKRRY